MQVSPIPAALLADLRSIDPGPAHPELDPHPSAAAIAESLRVDLLRGDLSSLACSIDSALEMGYAPAAAAEALAAVRQLEVAAARLAAALLNG